MLVSVLITRVRKPQCKHLRFTCLCSAVLALVIDNTAMRCVSRLHNVLVMEEDPGCDSHLRSSGDVDLHSTVVMDCSGFR